MVFFSARFHDPHNSKTIKKRSPENHAETVALAALGSEKNHKTTIGRNYALIGGLNSVRGRFEAFGAIPKGKRAIFTQGSWGRSEYWKWSSAQGVQG